MGKVRPGGAVVIPELRAFVAAALQRRLQWSSKSTIDEVLTVLARAGEVRIPLTGTDGLNTLPFELNINARGPLLRRARILQQVFSASVKFGGGKWDRNARVCVAKVDGSHGLPHLHLYRPSEGRCAKTGEDGGQVSLPWYKPQSVREAVMAACAMFLETEVEHDERAPELPIGNLPPEARAVRLVL